MESGSDFMGWMGCGIQGLRCDAAGGRENAAGHQKRRRMGRDVGDAGVQAMERGVERRPSAGRGMLLRAALARRRRWVGSAEPSTERIGQKPREG
jgi:hypothetical protein